MTTGLACPTCAGTTPPCTRCEIEALPPGLERMIREAAYAILGGPGPGPGARMVTIRPCESRVRHPEPEAGS
jgi:hypothetical protein